MSDADYVSYEFFDRHLARHRLSYFPADPLVSWTVERATQSRGWTFMVVVWRESPSHVRATDRREKAR